ncbi:MAG: hypothetical protein QNJ20_16250 [Paracoccaceae bacterium]|nr:hypothetical protein [Paracoccaceae bacterium]
MKAMVLLYDTVVLWTPREDYLDKYGGGSSKFLQFLDKTRYSTPLSVVPVGRAEWLLNRETTSDYLSPSDGSSPKFRDELASISTTYVGSRGKNGLVPVSDRDAAYKAAQYAWDSHPDKVRVIGRQVRNYFSDNLLEDIDRVRSWKRFSVEQATVNAIYQDVRAMSYLNCSIPITAPELMIGYEALNLADERLPRVDTSMSDSFPGIGRNLSHVEIVDFLTKLVSNQNLSWDDVIEYRRSESPNVRTHIQEYSLGRTYDEDLTLIAHSKDEVRKMIKRARALIDIGAAAMGSVPASATGPFGMAVGASVAVGTVRAFRILTGSTLVEDGLLNLLGRKEQKSFLLRSPFLKLARDELDSK